MQKTIITLAMIGLIGGTAAGAAAYHGGGNGNNGGGAGTGGPDTEQRAAIQEIMESGTYADWVEFHEENGMQGPMADLITEENWAQFQEMHQLRASGDFEAADAIAEELGLEFGRGQGGKGGKGKGAGRGMSDEVRTALENNDYTAWVDAVSDTPFGDEITGVITADNFAQLVQMHELMQAGDFESARAIAEELGLPQRGARGEGRGQGGMSDEVRAALASGTYTDFVSAVGDEDDERASYILDKITADNFAQFQEMHQLMQSGDREGAQAIAEELGLGLGLGGGRGHRGGGRSSGTGNGQNQ